MKEPKNQAKGKGKTREKVSGTTNASVKSSREVIGEFATFPKYTDCSVDWLGISIGTQTATLIGNEWAEELIERSGEIMREVGVKLNELSAKVLELEGVQISIRKLLHK